MSEQQKAETERLIIDGMNKLRDDLVAAHRAGRQATFDVEQMLIEGDDGMVRTCEPTGLFTYRITVSRPR
jgi:hypothetical protein